MAHCQNCRQPIADDLSTLRVCPGCGSEITPPQVSTEWVSIARVTNLAEVGYFADLLSGKGMEARVREHHEFSALDGRWQTIFVLQTLASQAEGAIALVNAELHSVEDHGPALELADDGDDPFRDAGSISVWKPLVAVLMAGGIFYYAGRAGWDRAAPARPSKPTLREALSESSTPLVTDSPPGQPWRRLHYDAASRAVWLEDDLDGDGQIDRLRRFQNGRLLDEVP